MKKLWKLTLRARQLVMMLCVLSTTVVAKADNVSLSLDEATGQYYVNMPFSGRNTLTLDGTVTSFRLFDDGGLGPHNYDPRYFYSYDCNGWMELIAPEGYVLKITGYMTVSYYDHLCIYDGSSDTDYAFIDGNQYMRDGVSTNVGQFMSSGRNMLLHFWADGTRQYAGLDMTVDLVPATVEHDINIVEVLGATVTASKTKAKAGELITLTVNGDIIDNTLYSVAGVRVHAEPRNLFESVCIREMETWYLPNEGKVVFSMPNCNATVVPVIVPGYEWTAEDGVYIDMPTRGTKSVYIYALAKSTSIFDDGGGGDAFGQSQYSIDYFHNYSRNCDSYLKLEAPEGYVIRLTGSMTTTYGDYLDVFDGYDEQTSTKLGDKLGYGSGTEDVGTLVSTGTEMMLHFRSNDNPTQTGLDLTAEVIPVTPDYDQGDVNGDHSVDVSDVNILVNIILGKDTADNYDGRADLIGDNGVDVSDVNAVVNIILGKNR